MPRFCVTVEITGQVSYIVEASNETEASARALEMADGGMRFGDLDVVDRWVSDVVDESAEHE